MLAISWMYAIMGLQSFCIQQTGPDVFFLLVEPCHVVFLWFCGPFFQVQGSIQFFFWVGYYRIKLKKDRFV